MNKIARRQLAVQEALRLLGNPYASLQIFDEEPADLESRPPSIAELSYARRQANQYTILSLVNPDGMKPEQKAVTVRRVRIKRGASKSDFTGGCTRIMRQYIPAIEKGRLRPHHKAFIARNQNRSPLERGYLLSELLRYDISDLPGLQGQFNREREDLTADKLKKIELKVFGDK